MVDHGVSQLDLERRFIDIDGNTRSNVFLQGSVLQTVVHPNLRKPCHSGNMDVHMVQNCDVFGNYLFQKRNDETWSSFSMLSLTH